MTEVVEGRSMGKGAGKSAEAKVAGDQSRQRNVATGERHTLNETYSVIASLLQTDIQPGYGPERAGDVKNSEASIEAARVAFGYAPAVGFEEGLQRTVEWYRAEFAKA